MAVLTPTASKLVPSFVPSVCSCNIISVTFGHSAGCFTCRVLHWQQILQFFSIDSSLQRFTLAQMTTQHNPTLLCRSIPLQTCVTTRNLPLRHSQNLVTALDVFTCRRPQPSCKFFLSKSALYTPSHTFLSFYDFTKPATMATLLGMPSSIQCSNFRRLNWSSSQLSRGDTRAPTMVLRLQFSVSTISFSFLAVARL